MAFALLLVVCAGRAQVGRAVEPLEGGLPLYSEHFAPKSYKASGDNWWVVQDRRGIIYVANNHGVLEFDGVNWRLIRTPAVARALAVDEDGTIYVGLIGDLGRLQPNERGNLQYASLLNELPPDERALGDVWTVHALPEGVYFQGRDFILRWNGATFRRWSAETTFHAAYSVSGRYFVRSANLGLLELREDSLVLLPGGEVFAQHPVWTLLEAEDGIVAGTRENGLLKIANGNVSPFPTDADDMLAGGALYHGCMLPNGHMALATRDRGVIIVDSNGSVRRVLDVPSGLPEPTINHVFADLDGALWIAFASQGLMRVDVLSPLAVFNQDVGLDGVVYHMTHHGDALYLSTGAGLYELTPADGRVRRIENRRRGASWGIQQVWASEPFGSDLLLATTRGLMGYDGETFFRLTSDRTYSVLASRVWEGRVYTGTDGGISMLHLDGDRWRVDDRIPLVGGRVTHVVEEPDGTLWFRAGQNTLYRLTAPAAGPVQLRRFDPDDGLPEDRFGLAPVGGAVAVIHHTGVYRFVDTDSGPRFRLETGLLSPFSPGPDSLLSVTEDNRGRVWMMYADRTEIGVTGPSGYTFESPDVLRLRNHSNPFAYVYVEAGGVAWLTHEGQLLRYDPSVEKRTDAAFPALIRRVTPLAAEWDVFSGTFTSGTGDVLVSQLEERVPRLAYSLNNLRIDFSTPSFSNRDLNEYQYILEGRDEGWSAWTTRSHVAYANLSGGNYRFRVRARNGLSIRSSEASFAFVVNHPWYLTPWAYLLYVGLGGALIVLGVHYQRMRVDNLRAREQARELAFERAVNERLQQVNERLRQADILKDQLLSNTSHELRSPLTAILGFTSVLKEEAPLSLQEYLDNIEENGHRLMRTITSMVDFARLQTGTVELHREPVDVGFEVAQVANRLAHAARRKQLRLDYQSFDEGLTAWMDRKCLERIIENVVGNAIKFTEEGGITVTVALRGDWVVLRVEDTGIGIEDTFLPELFRALHHENVSVDRSRRSFGLGLAITGRLVELLDGDIEIESRKGAGTVVTISFPVLYVEQRQGRESDSPSAA